MQRSVSAEAERLVALERIGVLDTTPERAFDGLAEVAAMACGMPMSLVSLVDADRQWFKASVGFPEASETTRENAFCSVAIRDDGILEVPDARLDPRFAGSRMVTDDPRVRCYAGLPLCLGDGLRVGTLCVMSPEPGALTPAQRTVLGHLAAITTRLLETRRAALELEVSEARFRAFSESSPLGVFAVEPDGTCSYTNARWRSTFDLDEAEARDRDWSRALHPDDRSSVMRDWRRTIGTLDVYEGEFRILRTDGGLRYVRALLCPVSGVNDEVIGHVGCVQDITERRAQRLALDRTRLLLERIGAIADVGGWDLDVASGALHWTDQTCRIHGLEPGYLPRLDEAIGFYAPEARSEIRASLERAVAEGRHWDLNVELPLIRVDGRRIWVQAVAHAELEHGRVVRLLGAVQDVTRRVEERQALAEQRELLHVTLQSIGDGVITTDAADRVTWLNPVAERMTGWTSAEALERPLSQVFHIVHEKTRRPAIDPVPVSLRRGTKESLADHTALISRGGEEFGIEDSVAPIRSPEGEILGAVVVFHDVSEQRRLVKEMTYRASHDALTGLVNRVELETRLDQALSRSREEGGAHSLVYIDLDQFKLINDACGHAVGDRLLQQVAKLIEGVVRSNDTLARIGGDEFAAILEDCPSEHAHRVAQQICERMSEFRFEHDGRRFRIGVSIGLVPIDSRWTDISGALQAADVSCYAAKEAGRNRVHVWFDTDRSMHERDRETRWAARLEQALDEERFELHAQRIATVSEEERGVRAEVLLRLRDEGGQLILPGAFLPAAERFHLAARVDRHVLDRVIARLETFPDLSLVRMLSVNVSGQSIGDLAFHRDTICALTRAGEDICSRLCLEITETVAVTNMADALVFVEQVRALGVCVMLDDFGAGASSFGYLKNLPVDILKIDGQYISTMLDDALADAAVRCFVDVARLTDVKTVAEYVDRPEVLERVEAIGIDYAQGFMLHRPEPLEHVLLRD